jgi:hypothetical protein
MNAKTPKPNGRPPSGKKLLTLRLEQHIIDHYRGTGKFSRQGWLQDVNDALAKVVQREIRAAEKRKLQAASLPPKVRKSRAASAPQTP